MEQVERQAGERRTGREQREAGRARADDGAHRPAGQAVKFVKDGGSEGPPAPLS